jgi:hypothetical protein
LFSEVIKLSDKIKKITVFDLSTVLAASTFWYKTILEMQPLRACFRARNTSVGGGLCNVV